MFSKDAFLYFNHFFHNQENNIEQQVTKLEESVKIAEFDVEYIHAGPVIRREDVFANYSIDARRKLLYKMLNFINSCPISYLTVVIDRKEAIDRISLSGKLTNAIHIAISMHQDFFAGFNKIVVYYDNGHTDFEDENTVILCVKLTDGLLLSHGTRHES